MISKICGVELDDFYVFGDFSVWHVSVLFSRDAAWGEQQRGRSKSRQEELCAMGAEGSRRWRVLRLPPFFEDLSVADPSAG
eukprot:symbB.v1.2.001981.t1/scaffold53.1/size378684/2